MQATVTSCGPLFDVAPISAKYPKNWSEKCIQTNDRVYELLRKKESIKFVVMSSLFGQYVDDDAVVMLRDGSVLPGANIASHYMVETIRRIEELGKTPIIFSPTPQNGSNIGRCLAKAEQFDENHAFCDFGRIATEVRQKRVFEFLKGVSEMSTVVWLHNEICNERTCRVSFDNTFIYRDWGHLAHEGSAYLGTHMNFHGLIKTAREKRAYNH